MITLDEIILILRHRKVQFDRVYHYKSGGQQRYVFVVDEHYYAAVWAPEFLLSVCKYPLFDLLPQAKRTYLELK